MLMGNNESTAWSDGRIFDRYVAWTLSTRRSVDIKSKAIVSLDSSTYSDF